MERYAEMTVTIPLWHYRQLLDLAGRVNALRGYTKADEYWSRKEVVALMGFDEGGCEDVNTVRTDG